MDAEFYERKIKEMHYMIQQCMRKQTIIKTGRPYH